MMQEDLGVPMLMKTLYYDCKRYIFICDQQVQ